MTTKTLWPYTILLTLGLASAGLPRPHSRPPERERLWTGPALGEAASTAGVRMAIRGRGGGQVTARKTLDQVAAERPFPDYQKWWVLGQRFSELMSEAIVSEWSALPGNNGELGGVKAVVLEYMKTVYNRRARASLVEDFVHKSFGRALQSGEFDALSYAFFRSAFELMERHPDRPDRGLGKERRLFTERVGQRFFQRLADDLRLDLPTDLEDERGFALLREAIGKVSAFFVEQGYCRDHAAFRFDVAQRHGGREIRQKESAFVSGLKQNGKAYALYEMGYPAILPSAVYLFNTLGEAQHHSSRTIEELFSRVGYEARETKDFDPTGYPSDMVVELWEIRKKD